MGFLSGTGCRRFFGFPLGQQISSCDAPSTGESPSLPAPDSGGHPQTSSGVLSPLSGPRSSLPTAFFQSLIASPLRHQTDEEHRLVDDEGINVQIEIEEALNSAVRYCLYHHLYDGRPQWGLSPPKNRLHYQPVFRDVTVTICVRMFRHHYLPISTNHYPATAPRMVAMPLCSSLRPLSGKPRL